VERLNPTEIKILYKAKDFSVIQEVFENSGSVFLKDYLGIIYNLEDVTDDGELFDPVKGWFQYFFLYEDIHTIRHFSKKALLAH
jgi:hypothetical protein